MQHKLSKIDKHKPLSVCVEYQCMLAVLLREGVLRTLYRNPAKDCGCAKQKRNNANYHGDSL